MKNKTKKSIFILFTAAAVILAGSGSVCSALAAESRVNSLPGTTAGIKIGRKKDKGDTKTPETPETTKTARIQPVIVHYSNSDGFYDEKSGDYFRVADASYDQVNLDGKWADEYPKLQEALDEMNVTIEEDAWESYDGMIESWHEMHDEGYGYDIPMEDRRRAKILRADEQVFTITGFCESYSGGAHGYYFYSGASFEPKTGRRIALSDVIRDEDGFRDAVDEQLDDWYSDSLLMDEVEGYLKEYTLDQYTWVLGPQGVTVYFSPYEIGAYASGAPEVNILFDEYPDLFTDKYGKAEGAYTVPLYQWQNLKLDITGDGRADNFLVSGDMGDYGSIPAFHIVINDRDYEFGEEDGWYAWYYGLEPLLVHTDADKWYLYLTCTSDNDLEETMVFDLNGRKPKIAGTMDGSSATLYFSEDGKWGVHSAESPIVHPESFRMQTRLQVLSTLNASKEYRTGDDGMPVTEETTWRIDSLRTLTLKENTSFDIVDENGQETGRSKKIRKDGILTLYRTDGESFVDAKTQDDMIVRIRIDREGDYGWPQYVNGYELEELFEGIMFAG